MAVDPYGKDRGRAHMRGTPTSEPQNPRLWEMLVVMARQKFPKYPSLPASKWIHQEYVKRGGTFVESKKQDVRHDKRGHMTHQGKKEEKERDDLSGKTAKEQQKKKQSKPPASIRKKVPQRKPGL